jgi:limonene-1,2-epoxide hydrolase
MVDKMNNTENSKRVVEHFWADMQANDFKAAGGFLHDDYLLEWPQSGERIRGRANFVAVNENYPPTLGIHRSSHHRRGR